MRILKYFFLIALLVCFAGAVFIATQRGDYEVTRSVYVKLPKTGVFQYLNDLNNWDDWYADASANREYSAVTTGKGAFMRWETAMNEGFVKTTGISADSINQIFDTNGLEADARWFLKDSVGGTKITLKVNGKMGFWPKVEAMFEGGPSEVMASEYAEVLRKFGKSAVSELTTYRIKVDGLVEQPTTHYLGQTIVSKIDKAPRNISIMMQNLQNFFKKNNMKMAGSPFVLYDYFDTKKGLTKFTVCGPVAEEVFVSPESDVTAGKMEGSLAVKTTLTGDYSHLPEAWGKTFSHITKNKYEESDTGSYIEIYRVAKDKVRKPSQWITEIYVPVKPLPPAPMPPTPSPTPSVSTPKPDPEKTNPMGEISIP